MQKLEHIDYLNMREGAQVLEADGKGDKVLRLTDGTMLKLFRRKRVLTSALWAPYAQRFADNCHALKTRKIECPVIIQVYRIPEIERDAVHYIPLAGCTLREKIQENPAGLREKLGLFIAQLHENGVYFRSAHLGNIVLTPQNTLGLIDIADLRTYRKPLGRGLRLRNFKHMLRYRADREWLLQDRDFLTHYLHGQNACNEEELTDALFH
jgi:tRNA A-37 threonylcarbamoyl transferase component Bud32